MDKDLSNYLSLINYLLNMMMITLFLLFILVALSISNDSSEDAQWKNQESRCIASGGKPVSYYYEDFMHSGKIKTIKCVFPALS